MAEVARRYMRTVEELASLSGLTENLIRTRLRNNVYKGEREGKVWLIPENEFNRILGVDKGSSDFGKELRMRELESRNKELEMKISTIENLLNTAAHIIGS